MKRWLFHSVVMLGMLAASQAGAEDWPQWLGPRRDSVWREEGILEKFPPGGPKVLWRAPVGAGYTGPAVAGERVFVMDRIPAAGSKPVNNSFSRTGGAGVERILCFSAKEGKLLWKHEYDCAYKIMYPLGPRCTPTVHEGKVYALGAMGHLFCLDAASGEVLWSKHLPTEYQCDVPPAGCACHPLIDGDKLICYAGGQGSLVVALHKDTGKEIWRSLNAAEIGYCPPVMIEKDGRKQLIIWHPEGVASLDPETGQPLWKQAFRSGMNMNISAPRLDGDLLFITSFFNGSLLLRLKGARDAEVVWEGKGSPQQRGSGMRGMMCTPFFADGHIFGVCGNGEMRCLKAESGQRLWDTLSATVPNQRPMQWANAFIVKQGDRFFLANERGELIIARLTPEKFAEIDRAQIIEPTHAVSGRDVVWSHPAFAHRCVFARNDKELICVSLAKEE